MWRGCIIHTWEWILKQEVKDWWIQNMKMELRELSGQSRDFEIGVFVIPKLRSWTEIIWEKVIRSTLESNFDIVNSREQKVDLWGEGLHKGVCVCVCVCERTHTHKFSQVQLFEISWGAVKYRLATVAESLDLGRRW